MAYLALIFVVGVWVFQQSSSLVNLTWLFAGLLFFLILFCLTKVQLLRPYCLRFKKIALIFSVFFLGFAWAHLLAVHRLSDALPTEWESKEVQIIGVVSSLPHALGNGTRFEFDVEQVLTQQAQVPRHISLSQYQNYSRHQDKPDQLMHFHPGERWMLRVKLKRPHSSINPGGFDFEAWALAKNIRAVGTIKLASDNHLVSPMVYQPFYIIQLGREKLRQKIASVLHDQPYLGIIQALVIGDEAAISQENWQVFLNTGTNHLMSISGLHITMLSGLTYALVFALWRRSEKLTLRLPARKSGLLAGAIIAMIYALLAGFSVPTQRTVLMLSIFGIALWSGRQVLMGRTLAYALLAVVLFDPWAVLAPGFWLSFGAVAIISYAVSGRIVSPGWLTATLRSQWAVTLGLIPFLILMFQQFSIISPLANAIAIPLVSTAIVPIALLGILLPIDQLLLIAHWLMAQTMWVLNFLAGLPWSTWQQQTPPLWSFLLALIGVLWCLMPKGIPLRFYGGVLCLPMLLIQPKALLHGEMYVTVLDVGQGLAVLVKTHRHVLLFDTGPQHSPQRNSGERIVLPYMRVEGINRLNGLIVSHDDNDHSGGMEVLMKEMPPNWLLSSFYSVAPSAGKTKHALCVDGQYWEWDGVIFEMLGPAFYSYEDQAVSDNNRSCVLKITSAYGSLLLTGDIERQAEAGLINLHSDKMKSDVLIVPHHGSKTSSTETFVEAVRPSIAIFTVGYRNRFGHPKKEILDRYQRKKASVHRTDYAGAVLIHFNQSGIEAKSWRDYQRHYWYEIDALAEKTPAS